MIRTILLKTSMLSEFPFIGGGVGPEFEDDQIRELFAYKYRIIYRINLDEIDIAAVFTAVGCSILRCGLSVSP